MTKVKQLHRHWLEDRSYRKAYDALEEEFALATALLKARARAGLTQGELAIRMNTSQSAIARLESGRTLPSARTLKKYADATGSRLRIALEPARKSARLAARP